MTNLRWQDYEKAVRGIARKYAKNNEELFLDLVNTGWVTVLRLDTTKAHTNLRTYVLQAVKFRMIDYLRITKPLKAYRLEAFVSSGAQWCQDKTGDIRYIKAKRSWESDEQDTWAVALLGSTDRPPFHVKSALYRSKHARFGRTYDEAP